MTPGLRVSGATVVFGSRRVLDRVDLDVPQGRWVSVIGPNGAGKSTLLHAIAGIAPLDEGSVELAGTDARRLRARARARAVALVPQTPVTPDGMSVVDYALLGCTPYLSFLGTETQADVDRAVDVLARLGIAELAERHVSTLSGGERQRVVLSRALLQDAPVLLLDEPTTALDIGHQQDVLELVDHLRHERGLAVVSTMHDLTLAGAYADELVLLDHGRVAERGAAVDVLTEEHLRRHFGANVTMVPGPNGPVVVPQRLSRIGVLS
jgi:iron complex transport system ATP-binding protein